MTDNWSGFTEAEIKSIGSNRKFNIDNKFARNGVAVAKQGSQRKFVKKNMVRERMLNGDKKPSYTVTTQSIPKDARLFIPQIPEEEEDEAEEEKKLEEKKKGENILEGRREREGPILKSQSIEISATKLLENDAKEEVSDPNIDALTKFQEKQKLMEEHNRQRKELLQKALADRTKKTREEAKRLNQIEEELKRLDAMLSNDVSIIRDQIEAASHDFMEAHLNMPPKHNLLLLQLNQQVMSKLK